MNKDVNSNFKKKKFERNSTFYNAHRITFISFGRIYHLESTNICILTLIIYLYIFLNNILIIYLFQ